MIFVCILLSFERHYIDLYKTFTILVLNITYLRKSLWGFQHEIHRCGGYTSSAVLCINHFSIFRKLCLLMKALSENTMYIFYCREGIFVLINVFLI